LKLEKLVAFHCSPALFGLKASNIVNCSKKDYPDLKKEILLLNRKLNKKGIFIETLCECDLNALIIVYKKKCLQEYLQRKDINDFLVNEGYPKSEAIEIYLKKLRLKLTCGGAFPHEIGAFLGYPIGDIYGFMHKETSVCLFTGYWKVYSNVEETKEKFKRYDKCRSAIMRMMSEGKDLAAILGCA